MIVIDKIKGILADDTTFYGLIIGLVALSSFGLGRLSVEKPSLDSEILIPVNSAAVTEAVVQKSDNLATTTIKAVETLPAATGTVYVGSKNSDKYHLPWCSGAKRITEANKVYFNSKAEAEAAGYTPAGNCKGI